MDFGSASSFVSPFRVDGGIIVTINSTYKYGKSTQNGGLFYIMNGIFEEQGSNHYDDISSIQGSVIYLVNSSAKFNNFTMQNTLAYRGGIFYIGEGSSLELINGTIKHSTALDRGGIIFAKDGLGLVEGYLKIENLEITSSISLNDGGAFYIESPKLALNFQNIVVSESMSLKGNGGFMNLISTASLIANGLQLKDSFSFQKGHFIYSETAEIIEVFNSTFVQQMYLEQLPIEIEQQYYSSGIMLYQAQKSMFTNCTFQSNILSQQGGALHINGGNFECNGCNFYNNTAYNGGAMYLLQTNSITLNNVYIKNANAYQNGGGININLPQGNTTIRNSTIYQSSCSQYTAGIYYTGEAEDAGLTTNQNIENVRILGTDNSNQPDQVQSEVPFIFLVLELDQIIFQELDAQNAVALYLEQESSFLKIKNVEDYVFINSTKIECSIDKLVLGDNGAGRIELDGDQYDWFDSTYFAPIQIYNTKQYKLIL
ncbi:UNKNOWN [Stylonychia lemnae]|uniref:Right handed beta helix domain-containing protein n=1 Tax=Stylonychia lemnae TaxID=5949 RepID=A0A078APJ6_STYLE|nr:UNKNOWN [Stylonychia lemnae]|eukprot:CDW84064.1 UNKNOWN [Stylonychia lemnae]